MSEQRHRRLNGWKRQQRNRRILAVSDVCHICGHTGADEIDHVIPLARGGTEQPSNLKPAHGAKPCATCGRKCNRTKGSKVFAPIIRRSGTLDRPPGGAGRVPGVGPADTAGLYSLAHTEPTGCP